MHRATWEPSTSTSSVKKGYPQFAQRGRGLGVRRALIQSDKDLLQLLGASFTTLCTLISSNCELFRSERNKCIDSELALKKIHGWNTAYEPSRVTKSYCPSTTVSATLDDYQALMECASRRRDSDVCHPTGELTVTIGHLTRSTLNHYTPIEDLEW